MATARPLRDVFADLAGDPDAHGVDPAELLREHGHPDLPDALVAEAVTSFADTAPLEVAEHLAPYVMANSAVPGVAGEVEPGAWLTALADAPPVGADPSAAGLDTADEPGPGTPGEADHTGTVEDPFSLDFGGGTGEGPTALDDGPDGGAGDGADAVPQLVDTPATGPDPEPADTGALPDALDGPDDLGPESDVDDLDA
jgi:hypothetical protein